VWFLALEEVNQASALEFLQRCIHKVQKMKDLSLQHDHQRQFELAQARLRSGTEDFEKYGRLQTASNGLALIC